MKRLAVASLLALFAAVCVSDTAQAQNPVGYPFFPYGFYQPYGAQYGTRVQTPPYFALNPPVYYGARHARPYGMSPFAAPPMVSAGAGYQGRLRSTFHEPARETPAPAGNPYLSHSAVVKPKVAQLGPVRSNPFTEPADQLVKN